MASHLILQLLTEGYTVRTTVRSLSNEEAVRQSLRSAEATNLEQLSFVAADLTKDDGWRDAVHNCDYVQHVASPFPAETPKNDDDLIVPARDGTLRVLKAAKEAGVKRVVFTSSFAAVGYGHQNKDIFDEQDWSVDEGLPVYHRSKLLAERAAWDFVTRSQPSPSSPELELTAINAVGIFGPILSKNLSSSIELIKSLVEGGIPSCPQLYFNIVDVRDLASLHIMAMTSPEVKNERLIASHDGQPLSLLDLANVVRRERPEKAGKVPRRQVPDWVIRIMALASPKARDLVPQLGQIRKVDSSKAKRLLGWETRPVEDTVRDMIDSLVEQGVI